MARSQPVQASRPRDGIYGLVNYISDSSIMSFYCVARYKPKQQKTLTKNTQRVHVPNN